MDFDLDQDLFVPVSVNRNVLMPPMAASASKKRRDAYAQLSSSRKDGGRSAERIRSLQLRPWSFPSYDGQKMLKHNSLNISFVVSFVVAMSFWPWVRKLSGTCCVVDDEGDESRRVA